MKRPHQNGDIINQYRILYILGQGGMGTTYAGENLQTKELVAIKVITFKRSQNFKTLELFEREVKILSQLDHPAIPKYIDHFQIDKPRDRLFYLVQQLADGESLASLIENGWNPNEAAVKVIAEKILEILIYLQSFSPPIIHRDIKPQNIICQHKQSGELSSLFLVDFGAVQDIYHNSLTGGSTVVGTYGYMAPEQFRGQAVLSTDLYGLGTTLIYLLTKKPPSELPQRKLKINYRPYVSISRDFADWLDRTIEPTTEDRFNSAIQALAFLKGERESFNIPYTQPIDSRIILNKTKTNLTITIKPIWLYTNYSLRFALIPLVWEIIPFILNWISSLTSYLRDDMFITGVSTFIIAFAIIGVLPIITFLFAIASRINLTIYPDYFHYERWLFGFLIQKVSGETKQILHANLKNSILALNRKQPIKVCNLYIKNKNHQFGCFLDEPEKDWLISEINDFLDRVVKGTSHSDEIKTLK